MPPKSATTRGQSSLQRDKDIIISPDDHAQLRSAFASAEISHEFQGFEGHNTFRSFFDALFDAVHSGKSNIRRSNKDYAPAYLNAFRLAVESCSHALADKKFRSYVIKAILDEFESDEISEPTADGYVKVLRSILQYIPHAEHLSLREWRDLTGHLKSSIQELCASQNSTEDDLAVRTASGRSFNTNSQSGTPLSLSRSTSMNHKNVERPSQAIGSSSRLDDLISCLSHLFSVAHAPVLDDARSLVEILFEYLDSAYQSTHMAGKLAAFKCILQVLTAAVTEDIELCFVVIKRSIPHVRRLFLPRTDGALKEQLLALLLYAESFLHRSLTDRNDREWHHELESLVEVLQSEYRKRAEKSLLSIEDLRFGRREPCTSLDNRAFGMRTGEDHAEQCWAILKTSNSISRLLQDQHARHVAKDEVHDVLDTPRKRRRVEHSTMAGRLLAQATRSDGDELLSNLQLIAFSVLEDNLSWADFKAVADFAVPLITSDEPTFASWAVVIATW